MNSHEHRVAVISIVVRDRTMSGKVNDVLSQHGESIRGRLGVPFRDLGISVITVLLEADPDEIGAISGAIGNISGVTLRSTMLT